MLIRLALETKSHHACADADRLALLEDCTPERYRTFLEAVYGFEARYEQALIQTPALEPRVIRGCSRLALLRHDLQGLGATARELAALPRPALPAFRDEAHAFGWIYVVERNTLLHNLVRRHLWRALPDQMQCAGMYLAAYDAPGARYRELALDIDEAARRASPREIVDAAHEAFACQRLWWFTRLRKTTKRLAS